MKLRKILIISIPFLFLGSCTVMIAQFCHQVSSPPQIAEAVESVDWLPAEATNINFYRSYGFTAYEFQISEPGFRKWAATVAREPSSEYVRYQPVTDVADLEENSFFAIERYNSLLGRDDDQPENFDYSEHRKATTIEIKNGLRGEMRRGSAGGCSIGYDRDTGTAYYQSNPR